MGGERIENHEDVAQEEIKRTVKAEAIPGNAPGALVRATTARPKVPTQALRHQKGCARWPSGTAKALGLAHCYLF